MAHHLILWPNDLIVPIVSSTPPPLRSPPPLPFPSLVSFQLRYPESFVWTSLLYVCQEWGSFMGVLGGHWGFLTRDWRTWSSLMSWMILFYPKKDTLKFSCWYLYKKCVKNGGSFMGVLGECWGFLTGDSEDMVILYVTDDLILPQWRYPESLFWYLIISVSRMGGPSLGYL